MPDDETRPLIDREGESEDESSQGQGCCANLKGWLRSNYFYVYCSHTLSAWGDRMWQFAVGLFLVNLAKDSLQLTAIYGFSSGGSVLLFGALIGDWVDRNPRLKVARITLIIQNLSIVICAVVLCMMLIYPDAMVTVWNGWLNTLCQFLVIFFADIAFLASTGNTIAIERDWVVEICGRDTKRLTRMTAVLRRVDLTTNILAPVGVGQIMTFGSLFIGAVFIAAWNFVSFFFEYYLLWKVYYSVPALAVKKEKKDSSPSKSNYEDIPSTSTEEITTVQPRRKCPNACLKIFSTFVTLYKGWRCYMNQSVCLAGLALSCLYMTVLGFDNITNGYAYAQGMSESILGAMMALGAITGILGTYGFQFFRGTFGLVRTGLISLICEISCLSMCVASIWAAGSPFDPTFSHTKPSKIIPNINCTYTRTDKNVLYSNSFHISNDHRNFPDTHVPENLLDSGLGDSVNWTCINTTAADVPPEREFLSLALLMTGIITARFGLWSADLTITQLILESVDETERGTVNGVQSSLNMLMDMVKFALVIVAPDPPTFGILILISFGFIIIGLFLYSVYLHRIRGHLFHIVEYLSYYGKDSEFYASQVEVGIPHHI